MELMQRLYRLCVISLAQTSTNYSPQICSIRLSKEHSRIIWLTGWGHILRKRMRKRRLIKSWMKLTEGMFLQACKRFYSNGNSNFMIRLAATPAFPELRRFKQGRRFKQWTGDDSKALMKVCFMMYCEGNRPRNIGFTRCTCLPYMISCIQMWSSAYLHFLISVTLQGVPISTALLSTLSKMCFIISRPIVKFFDHQVCVKVASRYRVNIPLSTTLLISKTSVLPMDSAHLSRNPAT